MDPRTRYSFRFDVFSFHIPLWERLLLEFQGREVKALEIGSLEGASATWIVDNLMANPKSHLTCVDPFLLSTEGDYLRNLQATGRWQQVTVLKQTSADALNRMACAGSKKHFDLIYIDADHHAASALQDAVLALPLLAQNGVMIFDDYGLDGVAVAVDAFLACNERDLTVIHRGWQLAVRRINGGITDENIHCVEQADGSSALDLRGNGIGAAGARAIAKSFAHLTALNLNGNSIGPIGTMEIGFGLRALTSLSLAGNQIGTAGAAVIGAHLPNLTMLDLESNQLGDEGAQIIARHLTRLTAVNFALNKLSDGGAHAIASNARELRSLDMRGNWITDEGAVALLDGCGQLTRLSLAFNKIGPRGARAIARRAARLEELELGWANLGDAAIAELSEGLGNSRSLGLEWNDVSDDGIGSLLPNIRRVRQLNLAANRISDSGAIKLIEELPQLQFLDLRGNPLTKEAVARARRAECSGRGIVIKC